MNVTTATPKEIDYRLADLYAMRNAAAAQLAAATVSAHRAAGDHGQPVRGGRRYKLTDAEAVAKTETISQGADWKATEAARIIARLDNATTALQEAEDAARVLDAEFTRRGGWSRFFLVTSSNGHIHSSMNCSTCRPTTEYGWLPEASGQTMTEAIAERDKLDSAALLCTVCFPDAPVEWTEKPVTADDTVCPGSGTLNYPRETARLGYASGNFGICRDCGQPASVTSTGKMRKHKKA